MWYEIILKIVLTILGFIITSLLGYLTAKVKEYRKKDKTQEDALKCLLRSAITSKYYVYTELKSIPIYERENVIYLHDQYKKMGGNSYVDDLVKVILELPIIKK